MRRGDSLPNGRDSIAAAGKGKVSEAERALQRLEAEALGDPSDRNLASWVHHARGAIAMAKKDPKGAIAELSQCDATDLVCHRELCLVQKKQGDAAGAAATQAKIHAGNQRNWVYLYVRSRVPSR